MFVNTFVIIVIMIILDSIWLKMFSGQFFAQQLSEIARLDGKGEWAVRMVPAILAYILMGLSLEIFVFRNASVQGLKMTMFYGFFLGLVVYGVFDLTNRAIIENYPLPMVIVDMAWGSFLFTATSYIVFQLQSRLSFL